MAGGHVEKRKKIKTEKDKGWGEQQDRWIPLLKTTAVLETQLAGKKIPV